MHWKSLPLRLALYALAIPLGGVIVGAGGMLAPYVSRYGHTRSPYETPEEFYARFWLWFWIGLGLTVIGMFQADAHIRRHLAEHGEGDWRDRED